MSPAHNAQNVSNPAIPSWRDNGGWTSGYRLYLGTDNPPTNVYNGTDIGYVYNVALPLQYSTQYYWRIAPYNSIGENNSSTVRSFTTVAPPLSGYTIVGGEGANYQNLSLAITDLNIRGVGEGGLIVYLNDNTFSGNFPAITATGYEDRPIVFKPAPGLTPVLNPSGGSGSACFKLVGSDYISFEDLTINGGTTQYGIWVVGSLADEVKNISISGCTFNMPFASTQNFGIIINGVTDSLRIVNNVISGPFNGIYIGGSSNPYLETKNAIISGNQISGSRNYGIYAFNASVDIAGNTITLNSGSSLDMYGIYCGWSGSIVNVRQNIIQGGSTSRFFYGLYGQSDNAVFSDNTIQNCASTDYAVYGAYMSGVAQLTNNLITGITATNNSQLYGIYLYSGTHTVHGNQIKNITSTGDIFGIYARAHNHTISSNQILGLYHSGGYSSLVCGVSVQSGTTNNVHNNMIGDLKNPYSTESLTISGIRIVSGATHNIYHNTVLLDPATSTGYYGSNSAALYLAGGAVYDIRNNIFINKTPTGGGKSVALWKTSAGFNEISVNSDANIYYVSPNQAFNYIACFGANIYNTLELYQASSGIREQNSLTEDVPFISSSQPYNLKINPAIATRVESGAIPIPGFAFDFEGDPRDGSTPDIGADEGVFTPVVLELLSPNVTISYSNGLVIISWDPVPNATYYKVFYSILPDSWNYSSFHTTTANQYATVPWLAGFFRV
ncbi:MAG: right-handed parallel beta-helix repeat-containing protein, partial [Candidatus Cloacimonadaceae bacterium]|nr:right-handed parallel beta-helix repeat-containing protein [Candidatus Cloacimonadaceae bacterium]